MQFSTPIQFKSLSFFHSQYIIFLSLNKLISVSSGTAISNIFCHFSGLSSLVLSKS